MRTCIVCTAELPDTPGPCPVCKSEPVYRTAIAVAEYGSSANGATPTPVSSDSSSSADEATLLSVPSQYLTPSDEMDTGIWAEETLVTGDATPTPALPTPTPISSLPGVIVPPTPTPTPTSSATGETPTPSDLPITHNSSGTPVSTNKPSGHSAGSTPSGQTSLEEQELVPGTLLVGRYRVVSPLGRGGMGRVYRAEDLKLGQTVALKFLPPAMSNDPAWLARFFSEVRTAREVTHGNVCRVHDIVEIPNPNGHSIHFLTMEYVDGENLSALLKRFGRLPTQKALEMAAQITAGLAAAHSKGVLHRDLKPANIMVDGRGHAKITDFGLATVAGDGRLSEVAGTPGYMAPELFTGGQASGRSDLFALGIVLYELFAGRLPWNTKNPKERQQTPPTPLKRYAPKVPADVERVIMQCLATTVTDRPVSAAFMMQEFPAVDMVAHAMAQGETITVDQLTASANETELPLRNAWALIGITLLGLASCFLFAPKATTLGVAPPALSYDEMLHRSQELLRELHIPDRATNTAAWLQQNGSIADYWKNDPRKIASASEGPLLLTYRTYSNSLLPIQLSPRNLPTQTDPAANRPGMVSIDVDSNGRLIRLVNMPDQEELNAQHQARPTDWNAAFAAAGLDPKLMHEVTPTITPPVAMNEQKEWAGTYPGHPDTPISFTASSWYGKFTYLRVMPPWNQPLAVAKGLIAATWSQIFLYLAFFGTAIPLVRRNVAMRRGDMRGAYTLASGVFLLFVVAAFCGFKPTGSPDATFSWLLTKISYGLLTAGIAWLGYVAMEPFARRRVPRLLISAALILKRQFTSLTVTRDILLGVSLAAACAGVEFALTALLKPLIPSVELWEVEPLLLGGPIPWLNTVLILAGTVIVNTVLAIPVFVALRAVLKRTYLTAGILAFILLLAHVSAHGEWASLLVEAVWAALLAYLISRVGALAAAVFVFVSKMLEQLPWTVDPNNWLAPPMYTGVAAVAALVIWSFYHAIGDQKPLGFIKLDD
ncbi:serine/threonine-protein kinase [Terriglobus tenax]|uniref:serine/threonine-protein kinase n=1 Tax=Terriglobus tenax TaxID=1111115 RepID=UPI0021DF7AEA|nr:serine/threonine-protein kinase [Terriglobus tenax]